MLQLNHAWIDRTGYTLSDMPTIESWLNRLSEPDAKRLRNLIQDVLEDNDSQATIEFKQVHRDGSTADWHFSASSPGVRRDGRRYVVGMAIDQTKQKLAEAKLLSLNEELEERVAKRTRQANRRARELQRLSHEMLVVEDRERKKIAMDLHDGLGQLLNVVKLKFGTLRQEPGLAAFAEPFDEIEATLADANQAARSLTQQISPPILYELGLVPAVQWLAEQTQQHYGLTVNVTAEREMGDSLDDQVLSMLYRAIRELLINTAKHANCNRADVLIEASKGDLLIQIRDLGVGFAVSKDILDNSGKGLGLFGIRERLEMIGGKLSIESVINAGTTIGMTVPLTRNVKEPGL